MGDRNSVPGGRSATGLPGQSGRAQWPASRPEHPRRADPPSSADGDGAGALLALARRLQHQLDRQTAALERMHADDPRADRAGGPAELLETARRMRRSTDGLLLLGGADLGRRGSGSRPVSAVLGDAIGLVIEPRRVALRPPPAATLTPRASVELAYLVAEVLDSVTPAPGTLVEVVPRVAADGGLSVEVRSGGWDERAGHASGIGVAAGIARGSSTGIAVHHAGDGSGLAAAGSIATIHCPSATVTVLAAAPPAFPSPPHQQPEPVNGRRPPQASAGERVDELFGPMPAMSADLVPADTPIFEAVASAWFRRAEEQATAESGTDGPADWESPERRGVAGRGRPGRARGHRGHHRERVAPPPPRQPAGSAAAGLGGHRAGPGGPRPGPRARAAGHLPARPAAGPPPRRRARRRGAGLLVGRVRHLSRIPATVNRCPPSRRRTSMRAVRGGWRTGGALR